jgi:hypothetical protein
MPRDRGSGVWIWLLTTLLVAGGALLVYHLATRPGDLAGRTDPAALYDQPSLLFTDPGLLGSAIEVRVTEAVRACMEEAGFDYRGPAVVEDLDGLLDPGADGYGIAAGPQVEPPHLGTGGPGSGAANAYEAALYGTGLAGATSVEGGCAAAGRAALDQALASLAAFPYSIEQLEADALAHPAYVAALAEWSACMGERGFPAASPDELVAAQAAALSAAASAEEARALADRERQMAAADFACRAGTLDPAVDEVAADLAPAFVAANRPQLAVLIPPPGEEGGAVEGLGTGDVQLTLRWWSTVDLDLLVTDPAGETIYFSHRTSGSGGQLDRDANYPCDTATSEPVENVFWPPGGAPAGDYHVTVTYQSSCGDLGSQAYELIVRLDGEVAQTVRSTIEYDQEVGLDVTYEGP